METKVCSTCGQEKLVDSFRKYYSGRDGRYSYCKECEKIEQRRKYLSKKQTVELSPAERSELEAINILYAKREAAGLKRLGNIRGKVSVTDIVAKHLEGM